MIRLIFGNLAFGLHKYYQEKEEPAQPTEAFLWIKTCHSNFQTRLFCQKININNLHHCSRFPRYSRVIVESESEILKPNHNLFPEHTLLRTERSESLFEKYKDWKGIKMAARKLPPLDGRATGHNKDIKVSFIYNPDCTPEAIPCLSSLCPSIYAFVLVLHAVMHLMQISNNAISRIWRRQSMTRLWDDSRLGEEFAGLLSPHEMVISPYLRFSCSNSDTWIF
jgi:hypothetical protein